MKQIILTIFILIDLISCNEKNTTKVERKEEPAIYSVSEKDAEMNKAIDSANNAIYKFDEAIKSKNPDYDHFALKMRFNTTKGGEHIWISRIFLKNNKYFGIVDNLPESTTEVHSGDTIEIANDKISDWMYIDNGRLRGGYIIRLLRNRMPEKERKQFDIENGVIVEE